MCGFGTNTPPPAELEEPCCMTAAATDMEDCLCWKPVRDKRRQQPKEGPNEVRARMCEDCAYRPDSPERAAIGGDVPYFDSRAPFFCHQGVPLVLSYRHPSGAVRDAEPGDYDPFRAKDRIFRANGQPGQLCAGWAAANRLPRGAR